MSRKIFGLLLTAGILLAVFLWGSWYLRKDTGTPPEEQKGTELVEVQPEERYQYLLMNHNNYVAVYRLPEEEIYEYTEVVLDQLPAVLQEEIREGKYLKNEEELYNFLENYTS